MPIVEIAARELDAGIAIVDLLSAPSPTPRAPRAACSSRAAPTSTTSASPTSSTRVTTADLATATMLVVRGGKKDYRLVKLRA